MKNVKILLLCALCIGMLASCKKKNTDDPPISKCYKGVVLYPDLVGTYVNIETTDNIGEVWAPFGGPSTYQHVVVLKTGKFKDILVNRHDTIYFKLNLDMTANCEGEFSASPGYVPIFPPNTIKQQYCPTYLSKTSCE